MHSIELDLKVLLNLEFLRVVACYGLNLNKGSELSCSELSVNYPN